MKYVEDYENIPGKEWAVRPYYKRELAEAYAPTISPASALNRLSKWMKLNLELDEAMRRTGYKGSQKIFTSLQVERIFRYLGKP